MLGLLGLPHSHTVVVCCVRHPGGLGRRVFAGKVDGDAGFGGVAVGLVGDHVAVVPLVA